MTVTIDGTNGITYPAGTGVMKVGPTLMTAQSATGTSVDFTGIPAGVKRVTLVLSRVASSGASIWQVQIGSGTFDTSGYVGNLQYSTNTASLTTGIQIIWTGNGTVSTWSAVIPFVNIGNNNWVTSGVMSGASSSAVNNFYFGGQKTLSGALDRIRLTTVNGTDTFNAGSVNILYE